MDFYDYSFTVTKIALACYVPAGTGDTIHKNRPSHGLALNVSGIKTYSFDNGERLVVSSGDIIYLPFRSNYTVESNSPGDCYAINFELSDDEVFSPFVTHTKNFDGYSELFRTASAAFTAKKDGYEMLCKSLLYSVIYKMVFEHSLEYGGTDTKRAIAPAVDYIHSHYAEGEISSDELARLCGISSAYFRRLFLKCYGTSPIKYVNDLRITRAKELLSQSECTLESVSVLSGFNNMCYFCRLFKKTTGKAPGEYRKASIQP